MLDRKEIMRLKSVLKQTEMVRGSLQVPPIPAEDLQSIYNIFRTSILDGYIPLKKPIGFCLNSSSVSLQSISANVTSRHPFLLESQVRVISNLAKLIIVNDEIPDGIVARNLNGRVKAGNLNIELGSYENKKKVKFLDPSIDIFTASRNIDLYLIVRECTRYQLMEDSMKQIEKIAMEVGESSEKYLPLNVHSSLTDYIHILPFNKHKIRYTLIGNISEKDMNLLWQNYIRSLDA